jgi:hypothetical protein
MSYFDKLKQVKPTQSASGSSGVKAVAETIVLSVLGYENANAEKEHDRLIVGKRLDNGEEIRAYLREDTNPGKFARHGVAEFSNYGHRKSPKSACEPGGEIRIDGAFPDKDRPGVYSCNWAVPVSHYPNEARSVRMYARLNKANIKEAGQGKSSVGVEVLKNTAAKAVTTFDQLRDELLKALTPVNAGNASVFALVRAFSRDGEVVSIPAYSRKDETVKDGYVFLSPEKSVESFLTGDTAALLKGVLDSGEAQVEVMGGTRFFVGRQTVDTQQEKGKLAEFDKRWRFPEGGGNGFVDSWVTLRFLMDGTGTPIVPHQMIVTHIGAATSSSPVVNFDQVPSPMALGMAPALLDARSEPGPDTDLAAAPAAPASAESTPADDLANLDVVIDDDVDALAAAQANYAAADVPAPAARQQQPAPRAAAPAAPAAAPEPAPAPAARVSAPRPF